MNRNKLKKCEFEHLFLQTLFERIGTMYRRKLSGLLRYILLSVVIGLLLLFTVSGILTSADIKDRLTSSLLHNGLSKISTEGLVYAMGFENPYFTQGLPEEIGPPLFSSLAFQFATGIKPGDIRSLLGSELPGFALYDTEIYVAGEGTNYTNLPVESAPPVEVMMKEREIAREKLEVEDTKEPQEPPEQTTNGKNVVYIYQSHSYESFLPLLKDADTPNDANVTNPKANMIAIGQKLTEELEQRGIGVLHDNTGMWDRLLDRGWEHGQAYKLSREIAASALKKNQNIKYLFDLHRDAARRKETTITLNSKPYAQLMFVIGKENKDFEKNKTMATQIHNMLEERYPGLSRGVIGKQGAGTNGKFNQDLSNNAILIEVGGVDNTLEELHRSMEALAEVFADYYWQAEKVDG